MILVLINLINLSINLLKNKEIDILEYFKVSSRQQNEKQFNVN